MGSVLKQRPSPLAFWYRQSSEPLVATTFHNDLLTPGIVDRADPPPISSGMIQVNVDHQGRLTFFEAIPPQRQSSPVHAAAVDWAPLFQLAVPRSIDAAACRTGGRSWPHPTRAPRGRHSGPTAADRFASKRRRSAAVQSRSC